MSTSRIADAKAWHEEHAEQQGHDPSSCWCCCTTCENSNPFFEMESDALRLSRRAAGPRPAPSPVPDPPS